MIARDTGWTVKVGLQVCDRDGEGVGYVDQATDAHGWMQVEVLGLGLQRLWIPYRPINSVDGQEGARQSSCQIETPFSPSLCDCGLSR